MIHIYCGDGKGKSTAAAGLALRCAGYGRKVLFVRFFKNDSSGELKGLRKLEIYGAIDINLNALEELTNSMQHLAVKVEYIDSLTMLVNLRHLELRAENIKDIRPLRNLRRVRYLEVSKNFWTSLQIKRIAKELDLRVRKYSDYYILDEEDEEDEEFYEFIRRLRHFH